MPSNDEKKQQQQQLQKRTVSTTTTTFEAGESNDGNATSLRLSSPPPPAATPTPAPTMQCLNGCGGGGVAPTEITKVIIDYEEGDLIGIILNDEIIITHIQKDTRADGKLKIGDRIISMNGRLIKDTDMFYHLIKKMHPQILIVVERKLLKTMLTEERIKQTNFEPNFDTCDYFIAHLSKLHGMQLGLSVKTGENSRVIVTKVECHSMAEQCYEVGDIVIDVNGERVTTKDATKLLLKKSLLIEGYASTIVERIKPEAAVSVRQIRYDKNRDPKVSADVVEIGRTEIGIIKQRLLLKENIPKLKSILIKSENRIETITTTTTTTTTTKRAKRRRKNCPGAGGGSPIDGSTKSRSVKFIKQAFEVPIQSDARDPSRLVSVPKDKKDRSRANYALSQARMPKSNFFSNL